MYLQPRPVHQRHANTILVKNKKETDIRGSLPRPSMEAWPLYCQYLDTSGTYDVISLFTGRHTQQREKRTPTTEWAELFRSNSSLERSAVRSMNRTCPWNGTRTWGTTMTGRCPWSDGGGSCDLCQNNSKTFSPRESKKQPGFMQEVIFLCDAYQW